MNLSSVHTVSINPSVQLIFFPPKKKKKTKIGYQLIIGRNRIRATNRVEF